MRQAKQDAKNINDTNIPSYAAYKKTIKTNLFRVNY